jgi:hypothetical protein
MDAFWDSDTSLYIVSRDVYDPATGQDINNPGVIFLDPLDEETIIYHLKRRDEALNAGQWERGIGIGLEVVGIGLGLFAPHPAAKLADVVLFIIGLELNEYGHGLQDEALEKLKGDPNGPGPNGPGPTEMGPGKKRSPKGYGSNGYIIAGSTRSQPQRPMREEPAKPSTRTAMAKGVPEPLMLIGAPSSAKPPSPVTSESGGDSDS